MTNTSTPKVHLCECGCGETTSSPIRKFRPGHDARLKSRLRALALEGKKRAINRLVALGWPVPIKAVAAPTTPAPV